MLAVVQGRDCPGLAQQQRRRHGQQCGEDSSLGTAGLLTITMVGRITFRDDVYSGR